MKRYLGDSVYAEMSCGMIKLTTNNGLGNTNTIYLEPEVYESLQDFVADQNQDQDNEDERSALEGYPEGK